ncbi:hypothetical protein M378DRAFT_173816 [Amanita muscaria Koide BX008]|uniref:Uncharacterized protein n=1 Tax=Amanita muscaria (strain Koide BX008) TaxID=946122 RepID=A0A0C2RXY2_AMAMK|nr:hypothetical protein M378DRAFT_173816 [Amanita muscaria Koide BX008]
MGRLIQDTSPNSLTGYSTVADLIRMEVLGRFVHECITWLERAEVEEREGMVSEDRYAQGVQNLCRFYMSLVKLLIVDPTSDVDSAEMAHFSLHLRTAQAVLYILAPVFSAPSWSMQRLSVLGQNVVKCVIICIDHSYPCRFLSLSRNTVYI